ncbi:hypothetical protein ACIBRY_04345 [Streptomyces anulatus]
MTETNTPASQTDTDPELSGVYLARIALHQACEAGYRDAVDNPPGAPTHTPGDGYLRSSGGEPWIKGQKFAKRRCSPREER